jgi:hypothetical protein
MMNSILVPAHLQKFEEKRGGFVSARSRLLRKCFELFSAGIEVVKSFPTGGTLS